MDKTQTAIYLIFISLEIFGISTLMEIYKKQIRKNKSKAWENKIVALLLSAASTGIIIAAHIFYPVLSQIGADLITDYIFYTICFYIIQRNVDMLIIKKLICTCVKHLLISKGFSEQEAENILSKPKTEDK